MDRQNVTDYQLIREFLDGNQTSIEILVNRYRSKVYTYIIFLVKDEHLAEDIFQETFIKVIKSLHKGRYQEEGKFLSWVVRIAHNLVIDHFRKQNQMKAQSNDNPQKDVFNSQKFSELT